jgi:methylated-DNA-[protein]-cysteine S-methyltransferase
MAALLIRTRLGWFWAVSRGDKLIASSLSRDREAASAAMARIDNAARSDAFLDRLAEDMRRYASGEEVGFASYPADLSSQPPFWRRAQLAARLIPRGEVRTYQWLAAQAGNPKGARAAGQAMAHNPVAPIIPCHRVIASDGSLGGYTGGLETKGALLKLEGVRFDRRGLALT